jgi:hypothetical protein
MTAHDPHDFANALSAKLAARSRHVCVLLGAGVGKACGLPDVASLQGDIVRDLSPEEKPLLETQLASGNIEQALSRLRRIAGLLGDGETIGGFTAQSARDLVPRQATFARSTTFRRFRSQALRLRQEM